MTKRSMTVQNTVGSTPVSPQSSPSSPPGKVAVAKSDFEQALKAIDTVMEAKQRQNNNQEADSEHEDSADSSDATKQQDNDDDERCRDLFFKHIQNSLKERLHQVAEPVDDEVFHKRYRGPILEQQIEEEQNEEAILQEEEEAIMKAADEAVRRATEMTKEDYDEMELLDQDALKRARELRVQVREKAAGLKQQQEAVLERAIQLAQREIQLLTHDILQEEVKTESAIEEESKRAHAEAHATRRKLLQQMSDSLQSLTDSLHRTVDGELPRNLRNFKETMQVVEESLKRNEQPQSLSQTEQAILSRSNEGSNEEEECYSTSALESDDPAALVDEDMVVDRSSPEFLVADLIGAYMFA